MYDAIVVGASFAGLSAAMQLARARRKLLVIDAGAPRNRFAEAAHGFLGQDGVAPATIMRTGLNQLSAYPSVEFADGLATRAWGEIDAFRVELDDGAPLAARRLILATGVRDALPDLPGLAERWGMSVLHCPYCHGYEMNRGPLGLLGGDPALALKAGLIAEWGPTTLFLQGRAAPDAETAAKLAARGVAIEAAPIAQLIGEAPRLSAARLADGREIALAGLFVAPRTRPASPLAEQLGCAFEDGMSGPYVRVDDRQQTSIPGVYAAGDLAMQMHNGTLASAAGAMAGFGAHQSLVGL